jgi:ATP-binding cassette subfamily F protein 3
LERRLGDGEFTTEKAKTRRKTKIAFGQREAGTGTALRVDELSMAFGDNKLFSGLTFQIPAGERLGITGPNGTGKSTLLKILLGQIKANGGEFTLDGKLSIGYYAQEATQLDPTRTILEEIRAARPELPEQQARAYLGRYGFTGNDAFKTIGTISGGEQSRVRLASLVLSQPQMLVLDEPTNHLDIASREALEEALSEYNGTIITVSHDRYFLDRIVDRLLVIRPGECKIYVGNYSAYLEQVEQATQARQATKSKTGKSGKNARAEREDQPSRSSPYDSLSVDAIEEMIMEHETKLFDLQEKFGDSNVYKDADSLADLQEETQRVTAELSELNEAWQNRIEGM